MNKKIVFLILHYFTIEETIECVESIFQKVKYDNYNIVIVDNGSTNGTGMLLQEKYINNSKIKIIISKENLGFANGNNLGFEYSKNTLNADFIVMINNDTYMIIDNFCEIILKEYEYSNFAVMGPRMLLPNNRIDDCYDEIPTIKQVKKEIFEEKCIYLLNKMYLYPLYKTFDMLRKLIKKSKKTIDTSIRKEDVILKGACLIFSPEYIKLFDGLDKRTFLYKEEELLRIRLKKNNLKSVYNPYLMIYHNESVATKKTTKTLRKKWDFIMKNMIKSNQILLEELKETEAKL